MSYDSALRAALAGIAGDNVFPDVAIELPGGGLYNDFVVTNHVATPINNWMTGVSAYQVTREQIDCYSTTKAGARATADAVIAAMLASSLNSSPQGFSAIQLSEQALFDQQTSMYRYLLEFQVEHA